MDLREIPEGPFRRHPWEIARASFVSGLLSRRGVSLAGRRVLDAGGGDGWVLKELARKHPEASSFVSWDPGYSEALMASLANGDGRIEFRRERPDERFDLVLLLDVLEHVEDDVGLAATLAEHNLEEGGALLVSVPAWPSLYGKHDQEMRHFRRYAPRQLERVLADAGLVVERKGGLFLSLLPARWIENRRSRTTNGASERAALSWEGSPFLAGVANRVLGLDTRISLLAADLGLELPGLSLWALCRRRPS